MLMSHCLVFASSPEFRFEGRRTAVRSYAENPAEGGQRQREWRLQVCAVRRVYPEAGGQTHVTPKGTGGELGAAHTWMLEISCALLAHPLRLLSQRNGQPGPRGGGSVRREPGFTTGFF